LLVYLKFDYLGLTLDSAEFVLLNNPNHLWLPLHDYTNYKDDLKVDKVLPNLSGMSLNALLVEHSLLL